jgi:hypothetical protein
MSLTVLQQQAIETLTARVAELSDKDRSFGQSLASQFKSKGSLSEKQWFWVTTLADRIETKGVPDFTDGLDADGSFIAIIELLAKAKTKIKSPTIEFNSADMKATFKSAPSAGKNPGSVYVYWAHSYAGKLDKDGVWSPTSAYKKHGMMAEQGRKLEQFMAKFCADPVATAKEYGSASGRCCFCNKTLTDPTSMQVGYGAKCASNYGLKWGAPKTTSKQLVCEAAA